MKLLLDMYKSAPKEQRDKVQLMAAERKSKAEVCSLARFWRRAEDSRALRLSVPSLGGRIEDARERAGGEGEEGE